MDTPTKVADAPETVAGERPFALDFTVSVQALVHPDPEGGYWAEVPGMPGCVTEADSLDELRANLAEAAEGWLEAKRDLEALRAEAGGR